MRTTPPMERLISSARLHNGAPTLAEIARDLAQSAPVPMPAAEYLRRLRDLTGMQPHRPVALYDKAGPASGGGRHELAWAIGEIEIPGRNPSYAEHRQAQSLYDGQEFEGQARFAQLVSDLREAGATLATDANVAAAKAVLEQLSTPSSAGADCAAAAQMVAGDCALKARIAARAKSIADARTALSPGTVLRALSISNPDWYPPDAPWLPEPVKRAVTPDWVSFAVALAVLALFAVPIAALVDKRRAFLRRRPPQSAPHRMRLIRDASAMLASAPEDYGEIRKALQRREPEFTSALDIEATVRATLAEGSGRIVPRQASLRSAAEYLVLIDRRCLNDLEAERVWMLIEPLRSGAVGFDVFWFHADPGWCTPEQEGPPVRIEELAARFPRHRLLLFASGVEMIDLFSGRPLWRLCGAGPLGAARHVDPGRGPRLGARGMAGGERLSRPGGALHQRRVQGAGTAVAGRSGRAWDAALSRWRRQRAAAARDAGYRSAALHGRE